MKRGKTKSTYQTKSILTFYIMHNSIVWLSTEDRSDDINTSG